MGRRKAMVSLFRMMAVRTSSRTGASWPMAKAWWKATPSSSTRHGMTRKVSPWPKTSLVDPVGQVVAARATVVAAVAEAMEVAEAMVVVATTTEEEAKASEVARAKVQEALVVEAMAAAAVATTTVARAKVGDGLRGRNQ